MFTGHLDPTFVKWLFTCIAWFSFPSDRFFLYSALGNTEGHCRKAINHLIVTQIITQQWAREDDEDTHEGG